MRCRIHLCIILVFPAGVFAGILRRTGGVMAMKQWERLCKKVKGASLAFRFSALYLILIIVPMVIYLSLYLNTVQDKINIEEQQKNYAILEAHIKELQQT